MPIFPLMKRYNRTNYSLEGIDGSAIDIPVGGDYDDIPDDDERTTFTDHVVYDTLYLHKKKVKVIPYQYKNGQSVRISGEKHPFRREFFQRWSEEIFTISKRWRQNGVNMYKIKDCSEEEVVGSFYASELVLVTTAPEDTYRIKAFLDEKLEDGVKWVQVQWEGYPKACAKWILKSEVTNA